MMIFTESDVENGDNDFPHAGANSIEAAAWHNHPDFEPAPYWHHDVSVVVLEGPYEPGVYGRLPEVDQLDVLKTKRGLQDITFTAVGYGRQWINPVFAEDDIVRICAEPHLIQINVPGFTGDYSAVAVEQSRHRRHVLWRLRWSQLPG